MGEHDCIQQEKIGEFTSSLNRIEKELYNGNGLVKIVPVLNQQVVQLTEAVKDLRTAISGLSKFASETEGGRLTVKSMTPWILVIIAALTLAFTVYSNNRVTKVKDDLEWKMRFKEDITPSETTRTLNVFPDTLNIEK